MAGELFAPLHLRSGAVLSNRIAKAAMQEDLAAPANCPTGGWWRCTGAGPRAVPGC